MIIRRRFYVVRSRKFDTEKLFPFAEKTFIINETGQKDVVDSIQTYGNYRGDFRKPGTILEKEKNTEGLSQKKIVDSLGRCENSNNKKLQEF